MAGARNSLAIAILTVAGAVGVGALVGLVAGYTRGMADRLLMMVNDALLAFPGILLALGLLAVMGPNKYGIVLALGDCLHALGRAHRARLGAVGARARIRRSLARDGQFGGLHRLAPRAAQLRRAADGAGDLDARLGAAGRRGALVPRPRRAAARGDLGQHAVRRAALHRPGGVARPSFPVCASRWRCSA